MGARGRWAIAGNVAFMLCCCAALPPAVSGQSLQGRFFTPKNTYLVGEPIFVTFEVVNNSQRPLWFGSNFGKPCFDNENVVVDRATRARHGWKRALNCYGGWAGSCSEGSTELAPGQAHSERILLNHYYEMGEPGLYKVSIERKVRAYSEDNFSTPIETMDSAAALDIQLVQGSKGELKAAFEPVLNDLKGSKGERRWQAVQAVTELAKPFLEQTVIDLSRNPEDVWAAVEGLYKLNTPQARKRLAELAESAEGNSTHERAMQALAALGDKHYLPLFYRLGRTLKGSEQGVAIESAGLLGGTQAVPFLSSFLSSDEPPVRMAAIRALAGTASRAALGPLILEIRDPDPDVRQIVNAALAQLTHLSASSNALDFVPNPTATFERWHAWQIEHGFRAPIYGPTDCAEPTPLN